MLIVLAPPMRVFFVSVHIYACVLSSNRVSAIYAHVFLLPPLIYACILPSIYMLVVSAMYA